MHSMQPINKSSAIAEMSRVFLVNSYHSHNRNPHRRRNIVYLYRTMKLWHPSVNQVAERNGTQL